LFFYRRQVSVRIFLFRYIPWWRRSGASIIICSGNAMFWELQLPKTISRLVYHTCSTYSLVYAYVLFQKRLK
jgi:hypothetical protein